jgi:hypothetical protein
MISKSSSHLIQMPSKQSFTRKSCGIDVTLTIANPCYYNLFSYPLSWMTQVWHEP